MDCTVQTVPCCFGGGGGSWVIAIWTELWMESVAMTAATPTQFRLARLKFWRTASSVRVCCAKTGLTLRTVNWQDQSHLRAGQLSSWELHIQLTGIKLNQLRLVHWSEHDLVHCTISTAQVGVSGDCHGLPVCCCKECGYINLWGRGELSYKLISLSAFVVRNENQHSKAHLLTLNTYEWCQNTNSVLSCRVAPGAG